MSTAQDERAALSALLLEVGPDAPTLCGGWRTRDLAAHLVLRERRPDAAPGILVPLLAGYTDHVQAGIANRHWPTLVEQVRTGPPLLSPYRLLDAQVNGLEFFVHHEDVRRAEGDWKPRQLAAATEDELWGRLTLVGRVGYRKSPVGVVLQRPGGATITVKGGPRTVTLCGEPSELVLHAFGRDAVQLETTGADVDVQAVLGLDRAF
ncbi:TIGR03085 family metal-binding protein [Rhodococcus sp. X156]|uniref:TIGR03085 family metal-binding protein n=1 Tax=Rhodococcus sp. X156 TaxID=2499145 RepID=UPI000FD9DB33|nr:TIGR03085 family metal-binding protein [Rhodococcus sp. X156]